LKQLHAIPLEKLLFLDTKKEETEQEKEEFINFVNKLKDKVKLRLNHKVSDSVIKNIHDYMNELFYVYESPKKAFVHTDIQ
jgi:hypothetical protein